MSNFIFGRYLPGNSWIHQMSPQSKLLLSFYFVIVIFFANNIWAYGALSVLILIVVIFSGVSNRLFSKGDSTTDLADHFYCFASNSLQQWWPRVLALWPVFN